MLVEGLGSEATFQPALSISSPNQMMPIQNLSTYQLSPQDLQLLDKGLSFCPTPSLPTQQLHTQILSHFNLYAQSLRLRYMRAKHTKHRQTQLTRETTTTAFINRRMKSFLHLASERQFAHIPDTPYWRTTSIPPRNQLQTTSINYTTRNLSGTQAESLKTLSTVKEVVTIKPADKNLGIVLMNTDDYIKQCMVHLTDSTTYRLATHYPAEQIRTQLQLLNCLIDYKAQLESYNKTKHNLPSDYRVPRFYGILKIHKKYTGLPPLRPIVSQTASILSPTAAFIDRVLQPIACSYPDYLHNSTSLSLKLESLHIPDDAILAAVDVASLYPSIPQTECLNIIYEEMHRNPHLLTFDPNLVIHLLHANINYNYLI